MDHFLAAAVVVATLFGPVLAVWVTRSIDESRQKRARQLEVFRALMRNRRSLLSPEYVNAFNLVEVEFNGVEGVTRAYSNVLDHYNTPSQSGDWWDKLKRLTTRLLYAMGKDLGYEMEQLDVLEGGYLPQAFGQVEEEQQVIRKLFADIARGVRTIPVTLVTPPSTPPTDPAPAPEADPAKNP